MASIGSPSADWLQLLAVTVEYRVGRSHVSGEHYRDATKGLA